VEAVNKRGTEGEKMNGTPTDEEIKEIVEFETEHTEFFPSETTLDEKVEYMKKIKTKRKDEKLYQYEKFAKLDAMVAQKNNDDAPCCATTEPVPLPKIVVSNDISLRDQSDEAENAIILTNNPPRIFVKSTNLVRIIYDKSTPVIDTLEESSLRGELARCADYVKLVNTSLIKNQPVWTERQTPPPLIVVKDILSKKSWNLPYLKGIIECPTLLDDNSLICVAGYHEPTNLYYIPDENLILPTIPDNPTSEDIHNSVELIREIVCDFPFEDEGSRTNFFALLFAAVLRPSISGVTPLTIITKPQAGVGASLLANCISNIISGRDADMKDAPERSEEWEKKMIAILRTGRTFFVFDNIEGKLYSSPFASILTSERYEGRILGKSETILLENNATWVANGNNIELGGDMPRRTVLVRLKSEDARPWQRSDFKHPKLIKWVLETRGNILAAVITIARAWLLSGKPLPASNVPHVGMYEDWRDRIGGILEFAGFTGFLDNLEKMYEEMDVDTGEWIGFTDVWYKIWNTRPTTTSELVSHIDRETNSGHHEFSEDEKMYDTLPEQILNAKAKGKDFSRSIGNALAKVNGRVFPNGLKIVKCGVSHQATQWRIDDTKKVKKTCTDSPGG
jgi:hypothetical protein